MPKQAKFSTAKVRQICQEYPHELLATPASNLRCNLCKRNCDAINMSVKCKKSFLWKATEKVRNINKNWRRRANPNLSKLFYNLIKEQVVSSFLAADIPPHKLNHPSLKSRFVTMGKVLPSETTARACVLLN